MKFIKNSIYITVLLLFISCGSSKSIDKTSNSTKTSTSKGVSYSGGSGSSFEDAVIIKASGSMEGIPAEYKYIANINGKRGIDWNMIQQSLQHQGKKSYDVISIQLSSNNKELVYYFDITSFFGKF